MYSYFFDIHDKNYSDNEIYKTINLSQNLNLNFYSHRDLKSYCLKYIDNY